MADKIKVTSRVNGSYVARLENGSVIKWPELGSVQMLTSDEILALANSTGGRYAIENRLMVHDEEMLKELRIEVEPEYFFTADDILALIQHGTEEQLEDALFYGGPGVRELIKDIAVENKIPDRNKISIIEKETGYNLTALMENYDEFEKSDDKPKRSRKASVFKPNQVVEGEQEKRPRQVFNPKEAPKANKPVESPYTRK